MFDFWKLMSRWGVINEKVNQRLHGETQQRPLEYGLELGLNWVDLEVPSMVRSVAKDTGYLGLSEGTPLVGAVESWRGSKQRQGVGSVGWDDAGVGQEETVKAVVSSSETSHGRWFR